jgi:hypothetical protein
MASNLQLDGQRAAGNCTLEAAPPRNTTEEANRSFQAFELHHLASTRHRVIPSFPSLRHFLTRLDLHYFAFLLGIRSPSRCLTSLSFV